MNLRKRIERLEARASGAPGGTDKSKVTSPGNGQSTVRENPMDALDRYMADLDHGTRGELTDDAMASEVRVPVEEVSRRRARAVYKLHLKFLQKSRVEQFDHQVVGPALGCLQDVLSSGSGRRADPVTIKLALKITEPLQLASAARHGRLADPEVPGAGERGDEDCVVVKFVSPKVPAKPEVPEEALRQMKSESQRKQ